MSHNYIYLFVPTINLILFIVHICTLLQIVFEFTIVETQFLFLFFTTEEIFTKRIYIILGILKRTIKNPHKKVEHCVKETISAHYCIRYTCKDFY